ncbi:MAG TPA: hypothetical protein VEG62_08885, partial [Acidimicrobiales bacterium]|nr:hypothetical protein [Acidimicrobiales bacterium]
VAFGVLAGNHEAELVYPATLPLSVSSPETRDAAKAAVKQLEARGGTAIGSWIRLATRVFAEGGGIRHAILLTDGKNESEEPEELDAALEGAVGLFECDCRGVGTDWVVAELRKVATVLLGTYDIVADPSGLEADFSRIMHGSLRRHVAEVALRVWTPQGAEIVALTQLKDDEPPLDMTGTRVDAGPRTGDYASGAWADESRDFYLAVKVPVGDVDDEMLAARVSLVVGDEPVAQQLVRAVWTDDVAKSTQMNRRVAQVRNEEALADVIQEVVDAHRAGDVERATDRAGRAVRMAHQAGNDDVQERISKLFEIEDPVTGRVRLRPKVEEVDVMTFEARSTRTSRRAHPEGG